MKNIYILGALELLLLSHGDYIVIITRSLREEIATEALCLIALLLIGSISQYAYPISHTQNHTQICVPSALQTCTVNGALSHQLVTYCYHMIGVVQISRAPRGVAKDLAFQNWAGSFVRSTGEKMYTYKPGSQS